MPEPAQTGRLRSWAGFLLKVSITTVLLALLLFQIDFREVSTLLTRLQSLELLAALLLSAAAVVLSAYKWQLLLAARGWNLSLRNLTRLYFVGLFMNNFLPSSIGGDVMRSYQVGKKIGSQEEAAASVILERLLATVGLAIPALIALLPNLHLVARFGVPIALFFCLSFTVVGMLAQPRLLEPLNQIKWQWWQKLLERVKEVYAIIRSLGCKTQVLLRVTAYSVLFQMVLILINFTLLRAMGIDRIGLWQFTLLVPIISAVSMIPVSINGLGVREAAYVLLFGPLGLSSSQAITLSMLFFLVVTLLSLAGGFFFLTERKGEGFIVAKQ